MQTLTFRIRYYLEIDKADQSDGRIIGLDWIGLKIAAYRQSTEAPRDREHENEGSTAPKKIPSKSSTGYLFRAAKPRQLGDLTPDFRREYLLPSLLPNQNNVSSKLMIQLLCFYYFYCFCCFHLELKFDFSGKKAIVFCPKCLHPRREDSQHSQSSL